MSLKGYDNYKDSGVDWLGEVPVHWEVRRIKDVVKVNPSTFKNVKYKNSLIEFLPMSNVNEITGTIKEFFFEPFENVKQGYTAFKNDDVLFAKITPCMENGNCVIVDGLQNNLGFGSTEFIVFRTNRLKLLNKHIFQFLRNARFLKKAENFMIGAAGQRRIPSEYLKIHPIAIPPLLEQTVIANYIDGKTSAIDSKIILLEQKIIHYQQLRKSLINETVCRGLDKNVKLKDSGIEWIGKIPEHWEVKRGKDLFKEISKKGYPNQPLLAASQKMGVVLKTMLEQRSMEAQKDFENFKLVKVGDFVISLRSFEGGIETAYYKGIISPVYTVFSFLKQMDIDYFKHLFKSDFFILYLQSIITGIRDGQSIKFVEIQNTFFAIPPINEQIAIANYLDEKTQQIDGIVFNLKAQIETLKELRKTLINDVVTGKIKVDGVKEETPLLGRRRTKDAILDGVLQK